MKQSKIITQQQKTFENLNIVDIKLVNKKHLKFSRKLSSKLTITRGEKVSHVGTGSSLHNGSPLYSETKKCKYCSNENENILQ